MKDKNDDSQSDARPFVTHGLLYTYLATATPESELAAELLAAGPRFGPDQLTICQWAAKLSDFLPTAYMRAYTVHLESLWRDGATPGEAYAYARAFLLAPVMCPKGWEDVSAPTVALADSLTGGPILPDNIPLYPLYREDKPGWRRLLDDLGF